MGHDRQLCTKTHLNVNINDRFSKQLFWVNGLFNPPWVIENLTGRALAQAQERNSAIAISAFICSLRDCAQNKDLGRGARVHDEVLKCGLLEKCSDALLTMYAKCGVLTKAKELFDFRRSRNVCTWNALIAAYIQKGQAQDAFNCFEKMQLEGLRPDAVTFSCILKACASLQASDKGKKIHDQIARQGLLQSNVVLGTALVNMYAKCGALAKARSVLEELPARNALTWSAMIAGYARHGEGRYALTCFEQMKREDVSPDAVTFTCILKACGSIGAIDKGECIHDEITKQGLLISDVVLGTALVDMYAKCGALAKARRVLHELSVRNVSSWNALIAGYVQHGGCKEALECFKQMQGEGHPPTVVTFSCIVRACGSMQAFDKVEEIYEEICKQGLLKKSIILGNALVDMYAKCGALEKAQRVLEELPLRNVISWSTLITGYAQEGKAEQALRCFEQMQFEGISPNVVTFICLLGACGRVEVADKGEKIHDQIAKQGLLGKDIVLGNALISMYARSGAFAKARHVLEELPLRNVVSWNALIAAYVQHDEGEQALVCFEQMQHDGFSPDAVSYICILKACAGVGAAAKGKQIHDQITKQGLLGHNILLGTALVDMYSKCGALAKAREVLEELPFRNTISWNAFITGAVKQGEGEQAVNCFEELQCEGFAPDAATFSCMLSACSHLGLVKEAQKCFLDMSAKYGTKPDLEHYCCMVDLFGRTGHLDKASCVMEKMPSFCIESWTTVLGACQKLGDANAASWAFQHAISRRN